MTMKRVITAAALLALPACGPLINLGGSDPASAFSLRYPGGGTLADATAPTVYVDEPVMSEGLGGRDIIVRGDSGRQSILKGGRWAATGGDIVRYYLVRALEDKTGARMIGEGGLDITAGCRTHTTVWSFELLPGGDAASDSVEVGIDLSLISFATGNLLYRERLTRTATVEGDTPDAVVAAFQAAMASLTGELASGLKMVVENCS